MAGGYTVGDTEITGVTFSYYTVIELLAFDRSEILVL